MNRLPLELKLQIVCSLPDDCRLVLREVDGGFVELVDSHTDTISRLETQMAIVVGIMTICGAAFLALSGQL